MRGTRIGQYKLERVLGEGAFGEVWLAHDERLNRPVAIKRLKPEVVGDADARRRFDSEAEILIGITEPHVVHVFDRVEIDGAPALVTEYMQGGSLSDLRKSRDEPFRPDEVSRWAEQAALGLSAMHRRGILHRDIKPANLFLSEDGNLSIGDFGLARNVDKTQTLGLQGTMPYMSPEQIKGLEIDARTDLFALGVSLYEMLIGERPFGDGVNRVERLSSARTQRKEVPATLSSTIDGLLEVDPEKRIQDADELLRRLRGGGSGVTLPIPSLKKTAMALLVVIAVIAGVYMGDVWSPGLRGGDCELGSPGERRVVILPFEYRGDPQFERVGEEIPKLVAARLDGVDAISVPPPSQVAGCAQAFESVNEGGQRLREWMARHDARLAVRGVISEVAGRMRIDLYFRYIGPGGDLESKTSMEVDRSNEVLAAVDEVGLRVLEKLLVEPRDDLAREALGSGASFEVMGLFLSGYRKLDNAAMREAVALDSTLAVGWYVLTWVDAFAGELEPRELRTTLAAARRHQDSLGPYGRLLVDAASAELDQDIALAEQILIETVGRYPDRPMGWLQLANIYYQHNAARGRSSLESRRPFERVAQLDSDLLVPHIFLRFLYAKAGDDQALREFIGDPPGPAGETVLAFTGGSQEDRDRILAKADWCGEGFGYFNLMIFVYPDNHRNMMQFIEAHDCDENRPADAAWIGLTMAHLNLGLGQLDEARRWFEAVPESFEAFRMEYQALAYSLPFVRVSDEEIRDVLGELKAWDPSRRVPVVDPEQFGLLEMRFNPHIGIHPHLRLYCLAALYARLGEVGAAMTVLDELTAMPVDEEAREFIEDLVVMGHARIDLSLGHTEEALKKFEQVNEYRYVARGVYSSFFQRADARYLRALCLLEVGRAEESIGWFKSAEGKMEYQFMYSGFGHLGVAEALEASGQPIQALPHYEKFLELYREADESFGPEIEFARERVKVLSES